MARFKCNFMEICYYNNLILFSLFAICMNLYYVLAFPRLSLINTQNICFLDFSIDFTPDNHKIYNIEKYDINNTVLMTGDEIPIFKIFQNYKNFSQDDQSLVYTGKDYNPWCFNQVYVHAVFYERMNLYLLHNAYIQGYEQLGTKGYYIDMYNCKWYYDPIKAKEKNNCNTSRVGYKYVIAPIARWLPTFGHWITDCICPLMFVDEWIWNLNPVVCLPRNPKELFREYMKILGH